MAFKIVEVVEAAKMTYVWVGFHMLANHQKKLLLSWREEILCGGRHDELRPGRMTERLVWLIVSPQLFERTRPLESEDLDEPYFGS